MYLLTPQNTTSYLPRCRVTRALLLAWTQYGQKPRPRRITRFIRDSVCYPRVRRIVVPDLTHPVPGDSPEGSAASQLPSDVSICPSSASEVSKWSSLVESVFLLSHSTITPNDTIRIITGRDNKVLL